MARDTVHHYRRYVALDERAYIADKLVCHIGPVCVHPFPWNKFLVIGNLVYVFYFRTALVRIVGQSLKHDHFSRIAFIRRLDSGSAYLICLKNIHAGRAV